MIYWISINTYLWKNIFSRWLESPLAPLSKIILTFLLSLLSLVVIGVLRNTEEIIKKQFNEKDILTSVVAINPTRYEDAYQKIEKSLYTEALLKKANPECEISYFRKPGIMAKDKDGAMIPIVVFFGTPPFWKEEWGEFERPEVYLFRDGNNHSSNELEIKGITLSPVSLPKIPIITAVTRGEGVLLVPYPMGHLLLNQGFSEILVLRSNGVDEMKGTHVKLEAYLAAEGANYSIFSALPILSQLEIFSDLQSYVRIGLALLIIIIIAIVLGNQSLLEFREQQYQFALLRSFGSPLYLIMITELIEKIFLALIGFLLAYLVLEPLSKLIQETGEQFSMINLKVHAEDLRLIMLGIVSGIVISWCFLVAIARKPIGLILS